VNETSDWDVKGVITLHRTTRMVRLLGKKGPSRSVKDVEDQPAPVGGGHGRGKKRKK